MAVSDRPICSKIALLSGDRPHPSPTRQACDRPIPPAIAPIPYQPGSVSVAIASFASPALALSGRHADEFQDGLGNKLSGRHADEFQDGLGNKLNERFEEEFQDGLGNKLNERFEEEFKDGMGNQ